MNFLDYHFFIACAPLLLFLLGCRKTQARICQICDLAGYPQGNGYFNQRTRTPQCNPTPDLWREAKDSAQGCLYGGVKEERSSCFHSHQPGLHQYSPQNPLLISKLKNEGRCWLRLMCLCLYFQLGSICFNRPVSFVS